MDDRQKKLDALQTKMLKVKDLPLKKTAKNLVFGHGSSTPKVLLIGEAPGAKEDEQGLPFVGMAGKQLDALLHLVDLTKQDVYITSILKYRPPNNRQPNLIEIKAHTPFLAEQIKILNPPLIVTLGNFATRFIIGGLDIEKMAKVPGISQIHGELQTIRFGALNLRVMPVYHPAAILYNRSLTKALESDFKKIPAFIA